MTLTCKDCKELIVGPLAPADIIDRDKREALELRMIYPILAAHIMRHHKDASLLSVGLVDLYALSLMARYFESANAANYAEIQDRLRAAAWVTLQEDLNFFKPHPPTESGHGTPQTRLKV